MVKVLNNYKGVILFFIVLVLCMIFYTNEIKRLDNMNASKNNTVYYE